MFGALQLGDISSAAYVDMQSIQQKLNAIRSMSMDTARTIVTQAMSAITEARSVGTSLPGSTNRDNVASHFQWHSDHIGSGEEAYDSADDLKKWSVQAFVEYNAVIAGNEAVARNSDMVLSDIWSSIKDVPTTIGKAVGSAASGIVGGLSGGLLSGLFSNPLGLAVIVGVAYLLLSGTGKRFVRKLGVA